MTEEELLNAKILIIDDVFLNLKLIEGILDKSGYTNYESFTNSRLAVERYKEWRPDLVFLDLDMPDPDGFAVLEELREIEENRYAAVVVITDQRDKSMRYRALELGAKDFLNKPYESTEVLLRIRNLIEVRLLHNAIKVNNEELESKVIERTKELYETQIDVIERLAHAVEYRDCETGMHTIRMSRYSACLAEALGLGENEVTCILNAASLHDIGKIAISDQTLLKPGKLTDEEFNEIKKHTTIGYDLLKGSSSEFLKMASMIALTHHERWDGKGYPKGLKGTEIPIYGRICALCDVFDALTSKRLYKEAWSLEDTVNYIKDSSGSFFDPDIVDRFLVVLPKIKELKERYQDK